MLNISLKGPVMRRLSDMHAFVAPRLADRPAPCSAPPSRRQWAIDIPNTSGADVRGIEVTIEGLESSDVFRAFYLSRTGAPRVLHSHRNSLIIRYETQWNQNLREVNQLCQEQPGKGGGKSMFLWDICLYGEHGPERCGLELSSIDVTASYRWIVADNSAMTVDSEAAALVWVPAH